MIGLIIRLLLGVIFVASAAAKLWSIDRFELYIFSYGFVSLNLSFLVARICIGVELALGVLLLTGWLRRLTLTLVALILLAFSIFLGFAALVGRTDSCQCFGQLADMPPAVSLLKNALLLVLTLLCTRLSASAEGRRWHRWAAAVIAAAALAVPFAVSVPDNWMFGATGEIYDEKALAEVLDEKLDSLEPRNSNKIIAFVTPGCPYCHMTRQKLDYIAARHHLPTESIIYIEPGDIGSRLFLETTRGASPLVLLIEEGTVSATFHYRNINERKITRALRR